MLWIVLVLFLAILVNQFSTDFSLRREFEALHHELRNIQDLLEKKTGS